MPDSRDALRTNAPRIRLADAPPDGDAVLICLTRGSGRLPRRIRDRIRDAGGRVPKWLPVAALAGRWVPISDDDDRTVALLSAPLGDDALALGARLTGLLTPERDHICLNLSDSDDDGQRRLRAFVSGLVLGFASHPINESVPGVTLVLSEPDQAAVVDELILAESTLLARTLAATPSNIKTPAWLAEQAKSLGALGLSVTVHDAKDLREQGFGGVLAVGAGSERPPNVTVIRHSRPGARRITLVGKGITFDSGGLSLKPPAGMTTMKTDMSGAAAVIATMAATARMALDVDVTGILANAENMPDGAAMRPGDVITHFGGRTSEVRNTDAEGRLVLADCIAFAATQRPDCIVDIATLTGAATVGLGRQYAALYSTDSATAESLRVQGIDSEKVWRMPLVDAYEQAIHSDIADAANSATDPAFQGGSITAALFLRPFAADVPWQHLDIAGVGRRESGTPGRPKGPTGYGARLLTQWLKHLAAQPS